MSLILEERENVVETRAKAKVFSRNPNSSSLKPNECFYSLYRNIEEFTLSPLV